jgi:hypothetical protein
MFKVIFFCNIFKFIDIIFEVFFCYFKIILRFDCTETNLISVLRTFARFNAYKKALFAVSEKSVGNNILAIIIKF